MIIRDVKSGNPWGKRQTSFLILGLALLALVLYFVSKNFITTVSNPHVFFCDLEQIEGDFFTNGGIKFSGVKTQSDDYAFSGKYASKLKISETTEYGIGFKLTDFKPGETYRASVWRYSPEGGTGILVASGDGDGAFYRAVDLPVATKRKWEQLETTFKIPTTRNVNKVSIFVYSFGKYVIYFDDLKIERISSNSENEILKDIPVLELKIEDKGMRKLKRKREEALSAGILETAEEDWVKAKLKSNDSDEENKVEIRLKGDWLDHLEGEKWSFRVKTKEDDVWNRMRYFSLHTPKARAFAHEWALHRLWKQEDVLTTQYDFVLLKLNGKDLGVYAYEEHFDKILIERQNRREGPIVRFSENAFWGGIKRHLQNLNDVDHGLEQPVKQMEASEINPFQEKKVFNSPTLNKQYQIAQNLLYQYKYGLQKAEAIFDIDKAAKYYAICDVMNAYHGTAWHNQRFYYNPVTSKLEFIGFDGYSKGLTHRNNYHGAGSFNTKRLKTWKLENLLFLNKAFTKQYAFYLEKYSTRRFMQTFLAEIEEELKIREEWIQTEFEDYQFNREDLVIYAQRMNLIVLPFNNHSLKAYTQSNSKNAKQLKVASFHGLPLEIIGAGPGSGLMTHTFKNKPLLESFRPRQIQAIFNNRTQKDSSIDITSSNIWKAFNDQVTVSYSDVEVKNSAKYLFFKVLGIDSVFYSEILTWPLPINFSPPQDLAKNVELSSNNIFEVNEKRIYFKKGKHTVGKDIIIPKGFEVIFFEGVHLNFVNKAKFISYSPVFMNGNIDEPIKIYSTDGTGNGFSVLQAEEESQLKYVIFDNLNTLDYKSWTLTGAVTFYESDVNINHSVFRNNHCEDALNIIRSEFSLNNSMITDAFSDGLDADFSKGYINNTRFQNTINDAMDFSGSNILIQQCVVENAGDKGVSVGEDTDASILSIEIKNSNIAVAAKDLSVLTIEKIEISDCQQGFIAFQKKPEYGGSTIIVEDYTVNNVRRLHNIREKCVLTLKDKLIKGQ